MLSVLGESSVSHTDVCCGVKSAAVGLAVGAAAVALAATVDEAAAVTEATAVAVVAEVALAAPVELAAGVAEASSVAVAATVALAVGMGVDVASGVALAQAARASTTKPQATPTQFRLVRLNITLSFTGCSAVRL
jgi:hypothetical protein